MSEPCGDGLDVLVVFALVRRISPPPRGGQRAPPSSPPTLRSNKVRGFEYLTPTHLGGRAPAHLPAAPHPKIQTPLPPSRAVPEPPSPPTPQAPQPCAREHARHGPIRCAATALVDLARHLLLDELALERLPVLRGVHRLHPLDAVRRRALRLLRTRAIGLGLGMGPGLGLGLGVGVRVGLALRLVEGGRPTVRRGRRSSGRSGRRGRRTVAGEAAVTSALRIELANKKRG